MNKMNKTNTVNRKKQPHSALCFAPSFDYRWLRTRQQNAEKCREKNRRKICWTPPSELEKKSSAAVGDRREKEAERREGKRRKMEKKRRKNRERRWEEEEEKISLIKGTRCGRGVRPPHCPLTEPDQNALRRKEESKRELRMREKSEMGGFIKR